MAPHSEENVLEHVVGVPTYVGVFLALMILTATTTAVAFVDLGPMNVVIMLVIAFAKATLVLLWFMHLKFSSRLSQGWACAAILWLVIMVVITLSDYLSRGIFT
jgi:cytochrome c oxidase subunit 4